MQTLFYTINLLRQNFHVDAPNKVWVTDITYIRTDEGWLYLAIVKDLFDRQIVGCATDSRITPIYASVR